MSSNLHPYASLTPEVVLNAVESFGVHCDGRIIALNSYENRVYQIGIEDEAPIIAKFYRPERWSDDAILEEHGFSLELARQEIPVVAPLADDDGKTLFHFDNFRFALFPRHGGHSPELEDAQTLQVIGRFLGRIHAVGNIKQFAHRPTISAQRYGWDSIDALSENPHVHTDTRRQYISTARECLQRIDSESSLFSDFHQLRLHGDCHPGNILWRNDHAHFVDLDDCLTGPAVQDLWMLLSGPRDEMQVQFYELIEGYETFHRFNPLELSLIEPLRTLRMIHYNAWIARRWDDPAFPLVFPWFTTPSYWHQQIGALEEQILKLSDPALAALSTGNYY